MSELSVDATSPSTRLNMASASNAGFMVPVLPFAGPGGIVPARESGVGPVRVPDDVFARLPVSTVPEFIGRAVPSGGAVSAPDGTDEATWRAVSGVTASAFWFRMAMIAPPPMSTATTPPPARRGMRLLARAGTPGA